MNKLTSVEAGLVTGNTNVGFDGSCPPLFVGVTNLGQEPFFLRQLPTASIGSVIREQRQANATTRTTGILTGLNCGSAAGGESPTHSCPVSFRWSSRPRPVNRLQATGEPRRVMRGGSKGVCAWLQETGQPDSVETQGKRSLSPRNSFYCMSIEGKHFYRFSYLKSDHWDLLRLRKLASVDTKCKLCLERSLSNDVHHLNYRNLFDVKLNDLVVLCRSCHNSVHEIIKKCQKINDTKSSRARWHRTVMAIRKSKWRENSLERHAKQKSKLRIFHTLRHALVCWHIIPTHSIISKPCGARFRKRFLKLITSSLSLTEFYRLCQQHKLIQLPTHK